MLDDFIWKNFKWISEKMSNGSSFRMIIGKYVGEYALKCNREAIETRVVRNQLSDNCVPFLNYELFQNTRVLIIVHCSHFITNIENNLNLFSYDFVFIWTLFHSYIRRCRFGVCISSLLKIQRHVHGNWLNESKTYTDVRKKTDENRIVLRKILSSIYPYFKFI